jgi:hypothetical protein
MRVFLEGYTGWILWLSMLAMFNAYAGWIYSIAMLAGYVRYAARLAKFPRPLALYIVYGG